MHLWIALSGMRKGKSEMSEQNTNPNNEIVHEVRKACRQFAMQYFHFCKTLVEEFGIEKATPLIQKAVFELSLDRSEQMRTKAQSLGLDPSFENFGKVSDLPFIGWKGWDPSLGGVRCPYAEVWLTYYDKYPWFKSLAPLYCDVIDTTNIENYSQSHSHRITKNLVKGDEACERIYYPDEKVKAGEFTYGTKRE